MRIRKHTLNVEKSKELLSKMPEGSIQKKECYVNMFFCQMYHRKFFVNEGYKIAYGYVNVSNKLYTRHAFIVDANNEAIDPTLALREDFDKDVDDKSGTYFSFYIFDDVDNYVDAVGENDRYPDLIKPMREKERFIDCLLYTSPSPRD